MARSDLPNGVPPDNSAINGQALATGANFSSAGPADHGDDEFALPETAIPAFNAYDETVRPPFGDCTDLSRVTIEVDDDDDDDEKTDDEYKMVHGPHLPAPVLILIAVGFLLAGFIAYALSTQDGGLPLCSDQPEWNQYNCRPG